MKQYESITPDDLRANYKYFLDAIIPVCEEVGVKMACHPDDPAWPIFGLPRIAHSQEDYDKIEQNYFDGLQPCTATLSWLDCVPGDQLTVDGLADRLAECWQNFSLTADS